jgi:hypothetical protein
MKKNKSKTPEAEKDLAQTPKWLIASVCHLIGIKSFNLDVCSLESTKKARRCFSLSEREENSLELGWSMWNWCNPPFTNILPFCVKAAEQASSGFKNTAMIMPSSSEVGYVRHAKAHADTIIEMPFRLKFLRPNGQPFISEKTGKEQSPQFSCLIAIYTPLGLVKPTTSIYHDFRKGFYKAGMK